MRILKDAGLMKALLLVAALGAANLYVSAKANLLEAQGYPFGFPDIDGGICVFQGLSGAYCEVYPINECDFAACVATALVP